MYNAHQEFLYAIYVKTLILKNTEAFCVRLLEHVTLLYKIVN